MRPRKGVCCSDSTSSASATRSCGPRRSPTSSRATPGCTAEVCTFDFEATYGQRGHQYTEVHHVVPLHASGETKTRVADLILLCANCHRMIHRSAPWLTPDELRGLLPAQR